MPELPYTIAIATRNRLDALRLSIPRMVSQSRKPSQIVVADSSDNHEAIHSAITEITKSARVPTTILKTEKGLTTKEIEPLNTPPIQLSSFQTMTLFGSRTPRKFKCEYTNGILKTK